MVIRVPLPFSERQTQKQLVHPGQPLLGEAVDGLKLQVIVQQDGTAVESSRSDPGSRQEEGMGGPDLGCADQQGLAGFQPVDRPSSQAVGLPASQQALPASQPAFQSESNSLPVHQLTFHQTNSPAS